MEFLILLAVIPVLGIFALVSWFLWLKPEPPVMDWKECVRREEEAKQKREEMAKRVIFPSVVLFAEQDPLKYDFYASCVDDD